MKQFFETFVKTMWQIFLYTFEVLGVSFLLAYLSSFLKDICSVYEFIERTLMCYTFYQILVVIILTNLNDIKKDIYLAYITNIKRILLFLDSKDNKVKNEVLKNINYQLDGSTFNNGEFRKKYEKLKCDFEKNSISKTYIELELINSEQRYENVSLNWRFSFLLRLFK